jgi:hypothetical protein
VVLKSGAGWRTRAGLREEARLLDRRRGPHVVELLDVLEVERRTTLVLRFVPLVAPPEFAHLDPEPEHILLTADGVPVLCGFGRYTSRRSRSSSVSRRTTSLAVPSFTKTTGGRGTLL